jgi:hypothetical protein
MYFQTGQVIFVPKWSKGEFVNIISLILFGQNHLYVKDVVLQGIPLFRRVSEDSACKSENLRIPISCLDDRAIPSGRPTDQASSVRTTYIYVRTITISRNYCSSLHPSGRLNSPSGRLSVIDQLQILSKFNLREDCFNRPDDVDSRPDALLHKARILIQILPSRRQSALVRTRV